MLRLMLDSHPRIAWLNEFEYAVDRISENGAYPDVASYIEFLETVRSFQQNKFEIDPSLTYSELVNGFLEQKSRRAGGAEIVGATVHRRFDLLRHIWPDARFIHIVRDPRDVARSVVNMGWFGNVWKGIEFWIEAERRWERFGAILPEDRFIEVRYESLIADSERELRRICAFLGVEFDRMMYDYARRTTYDLPDPTLARQWQEKMSDRDIGLVEERVGDMLTTRGYQQAGVPRIRTTPLLRIRLRLHSRAARTLFRLRRYGFGIVAGGYIASRMGLNAWRKRILHEANAIDAAYLK